MMRPSALACLARRRPISCRNGARGCPKHERMSSKCEQVPRWRPGGDFQLMLHKERAGTALEDINYPLLETPQEWIIHGFSHANYLAELGHKAQSEIYKKSSLDQAMKDAFRKARRFLMTAKGFLRGRGHLAVAPSQRHRRYPGVDGSPIARTTTAIALAAAPDCTDLSRDWLVP
jgi:hypothetical protein